MEEKRIASKLSNRSSAGLAASHSTVVSLALPALYFTCLPRAGRRRRHKREAAWDCLVCAQSAHFAQLSHRRAWRGGMPSCRRSACGKETCEGLQPPSAVSTARSALHAMQYMVEATL